MKNRSMGRRLCHALGAAGLACALSGAAIAASQGTYHLFTMAGSTGTVDEKDQDEVVFKNGRVMIDSSVNRGKVTLRYAVPRPLDNSSWDVTGWWAGAGYRDNGDHARVVVKMKVINGQTGAVTTVCTFDSDDYGPTDDADGFTSRYVEGPNLPMSLYFEEAVFLEVTLTRRSAEGDPQVLQVHGWFEES